MSDSVALPTALDVLEARLHSSEDPNELLQVLRTLQRLGLSRTDLQVHVERLRAVNDATTENEAVEERALLALDMILGNGSAFTLSWDPATIASIYLPRHITPAALIVAMPFALEPSDLLPPRPAATGPELTATLLQLYGRSLDAGGTPEHATFFRVPKQGFTSRPAALLSLPDRITFESLATLVEERVEAAMPPSVTWPRRRELKGDHGDFRQQPLEWDAAYIVKADIAAFYECVDHSLLATLVSGLGVHGGIAQALEAFLDTIMGSSAGLPQGPPASDLFASLYLSPIDRRLEGSGVQHLRYADDYYIAAESVGAGRQILEDLEGLLGGLGLRLSVDKSQVMRMKTYQDAVGGPSRRVRALQARVFAHRRSSMLNVEDVADLEESLRDAGADEESLFDVLYHQTMPLEELIDSLRQSIEPSEAEAYGLVLRDLVAKLRRGDLPDQMLDAERDVRQALTILASRQISLPGEDLRVLLTWFPRAAPTVATYLIEVAKSDQEAFGSVFLEVLRTGEFTDWVTAWVCYAAEVGASSERASVTEALVVACSSSSVGPLTRVGAARALAGLGRLTETLWDSLENVVTPALRSDMLFSQMATPELYPWKPPVLELGSAHSG